MTANSKTSLTADIVELGNVRQTSTRGRIQRTHDGFVDSSSHVQSSATLLSIRQCLNFKASVAVDDLAFIQSRYSPEVANKIMLQVRSFLNYEFGQLRVHKKRQKLVVQHHCLESLMAGLLRVQYHSNRIALPVSPLQGDLSNECGVFLTWGVGNSLAEAEGERLRSIKPRHS